MMTTHRLATSAFPFVLLLFVASFPEVRAQPAPVKPDSQEECLAQTLKIPETLDALALAEGSWVADVGAGDGLYIPGLAGRVGSGGRVFAVDIDEKRAIPKLKELAEKRSLTNISIVHSEPADPKLPPGRLDAVLMVITYHEVAPYEEMLRHILAALKPGGRFVVVDLMPKKTRGLPRVDQTRNHTIAPEVAEPEFRAAGFEIVTRQDRFIDRPNEEEARWMIVCRRPPE